MEHFDIDAILSEGVPRADIDELCMEVLHDIDVRYFEPPRTSSPLTVMCPDSTEGDPHTDGLDDPDRTFGLADYDGVPPQEAEAMQPIEEEEPNEPAFLIVRNRHALNTMSAILEKIALFSASQTAAIGRGRNNAGLRRSQAELNEMVMLALQASKLLAEGRVPREAIRYFDLPR